MNVAKQCKHSIVSNAGSPSGESQPAASAINSFRKIDRYRRRADDGVERLGLQPVRVFAAAVLMVSCSCMTGSAQVSEPPSVPSLENRGSTTGALSNANGQYWQEYDLRAYTQQLKNVDQPQQAIVDWILRETGTDVWFRQPMGLLNADRSTLRVYHTKEMHTVVQRVYEQFVNGTLEPQIFGLRVITINNPNWRTRAMPWMNSVNVNSAGVDAWLMSKENTAIVLAMLRGRSDFKELQSIDIVTYNGQSHMFEQMRSRNYIKDYQKTERGWPPYMPVSTDIREGYGIELSPLLDRKMETVDLVLKSSIDQVEKLRSVNLDLPMPSGETYTTQIQVPQVVSWRLHERFRWPVDSTLMLSCGVIAAPGGKANNTLLGQSSSSLGLDRLIPGNNAERADALLLIEYKGRASSQLGQTPTAVQAANPMSRGRY